MYPRPGRIEKLTELPVQTVTVAGQVLSYGSCDQADKREARTGHGRERKHMQAVDVEIDASYRA